MTLRLTLRLTLAALALMLPVVAGAADRNDDIRDRPLPEYAQRGYGSGGGKYDGRRALCKRVPQFRKQLGAGHPQVRKLERQCRRMGFDS